MANLFAPEPSVLDGVMYYDQSPHRGIQHYLMHTKPNQSSIVRLVGAPFLYWSVFGLCHSQQWYQAVIDSQDTYEKYFCSKSNLKRFFLELMCAWFVIDRNANKPKILVAPIQAFQDIFRHRDVTGCIPGDTVGEAVEFDVCTFAPPKYTGKQVCGYSVCGYPSGLKIPTTTGYFPLTGNKNIGFGDGRDWIYNYNLFPVDYSMLFTKNKSVLTTQELIDIQNLPSINACMHDNTPSNIRFYSDKDIVVPQFAQPSSGATTLQSVSRVTDGFKPTDQVVSFSGTCSECKGKGKIQLLVSNVDCKTCNGKGQV